MKVKRNEVDFAIFINRCFVLVHCEMFKKINMVSNVRGLNEIPTYSVVCVVRVEPKNDN